MNQAEKSQLIIHRLVYLVFFVEEIIPFILGGRLEQAYSPVVIGIVVLCAGLEELMTHVGFMRKNDVRKWIKFAQCLLSTAIFFFWQELGAIELVAVTMLIMQSVDFFRYAEIERRAAVYLYTLSIGLPIILAIEVRSINDNHLYWTYLLCNVVALFAMFSVEAWDVLSFIIKKDKIIYDQRHKYEDEMEKTADMLEIQHKMKQTNLLLNTQKVELQSAYKQIQAANQEMQVQADILSYIAASFDMEKISRQIADSIMETRNLSFCAVYIQEGVYLNKRSQCVVKAQIPELETTLKNNIKEIYQDMVNRNVGEEVFHGEFKEQVAFLQEENINSLYIKVLEHEGSSYGLFMAGTEKREKFTDNMSFYNVIIAQFDIAVNNVRNYMEVQHMARKDGLTGINNRIYFTQLFDACTKEIVSKQGYISTALLDIDKFKSVNDTYGHLAGDEVIKRIAVLTEECIERYDGFVCRYGGEEFVSVLPGRNIAQAVPVIEELFEILCGQIVEYNEYKIPISVSIGLTGYPEICKDTNELLKRADLCMYYAKEHGRHQINVDDGSIQKD